MAEVDVEAFVGPDARDRRRHVEALQIGGQLLVRVLVVLVERRARRRGRGVELGALHEMRRLLRIERDPSRHVTRADERRARRRQLVGRAEQMALLDAAREIGRREQLRHGVGVHDLGRGVGLRRAEPARDDRGAGRARREAGFRHLGHDVQRVAVGRVVRGFVGRHRPAEAQALLTGDRAAMIRRAVRQRRLVDAVVVARDREVGLARGVVHRPQMIEVDVVDHAVIAGAVLEAVPDHRVERLALDVELRVHLDGMPDGERAAVIGLHGEVEHAQLVDGRDVGFGIGVVSRVHVVDTGRQRRRRLADEAERAEAPAVVELDGEAARVAYIAAGALFEGYRHDRSGRARVGAVERRVERRRPLAAAVDETRTIAVGAERARGTVVRPAVRARPLHVRADAGERVVDRVLVGRVGGAAHAAGDESGGADVARRARRLGRPVDVEAERDAERAGVRVATGVARRVAVLADDLVAARRRRRRPPLRRAARCGSRCDVHECGQRQNDREERGPGLRVFHAATDMRPAPRKSSRSSHKTETFAGPAQISRHGRSRPSHESAGSSALHAQAR